MEWVSFCRRPFESQGGYFSYVYELAIITADYSDYMERKNISGVALRQIIINGASRQHFEGLQNGSRLLERLGPKGVQLGVGTTRNEQLHRELKSWIRNIYQTHEDRLQTGLRIFLFAKLLTHSSAANRELTNSKTVFTAEVNLYYRWKAEICSIFFHNHLFSLQLLYQWL